tara:strand:+ start:90 stop:560 length:471 start_codon:yes stop_codon:yes gene_type:complete
MELVSFGEAIKALKDGRRVQRKGWNGKGLFVFMQIPSNIGIDTILKMHSLPDHVKESFRERKEGIRYNNQLALVSPDNEISGWAPSTSDALADDWIILDPYDYGDRLMVEIDQLCKRIYKLKTALDTKAVPLGAMIVLKKQLDIMNEYNDILRSRL